MRIAKKLVLVLVLSGSMLVYWFQLDPCLNIWVRPLNIDEIYSSSVLVCVLLVTYCAIILLISSEDELLAIMCFLFIIELQP